MRGHVPTGAVLLLLLLILLLEARLPDWEVCWLCAGGRSCCCVCGWLLGREDALHLLGDGMLLGDWCGHCSGGGGGGGVGKGESMLRWIAGLDVGSNLEMRETDYGLRGRRSDTTSDYATAAAKWGWS